MIDKDALRNIALAISSFKSDSQVLNLLSRAFAADQPQFGAVIVVDSLGSGAIERAIEENGWRVRYINSETNLGSAGNLDLRLRTAAEMGLEWCFAVNHDGEVTPAKVAELVAHAASGERIGAVYPQLIFERAGSRPDSPRTSFSTYGLIAKGSDHNGCLEVLWSSSNGALFRLDAIREGVTAWPQLWMGYEDLAIGWELHRRGWKQILCADVQVEDDYEFRPAHFLGRTVYLPTKPPWYTYYHVRNQLLIQRGTKGSALSRTSVATRFLVDIALILFARRQKATRLRLLFRGLADGLRGVSGKGPVP